MSDIIPLTDTQTILLKLIILHGLTKQEEWLTFLALRQLSKYTYDFTKQFYRQTMKKLSKSVEEIDKNIFGNDTTNHYYILGNLKHGPVIEYNIIGSGIKKRIREERYTYYKNKICGKCITKINNKLFRISYYNNDIRIKDYKLLYGRISSISYSDRTYILDKI